MADASFLFPLREGKLHPWVLQFELELIAHPLFKVPLGSSLMAHHSLLLGCVSAPPSLLGCPGPAVAAAARKTAAKP